MLSWEWNIRFLHHCMDCGCTLQKDESLIIFLWLTHSPPPLPHSPHVVTSTQNSQYHSNCLEQEGLTPSWSTCIDFCALSKLFICEGNWFFLISDNSIFTSTHVQYSQKMKLSSPLPPTHCTLDCTDASKCPCYLKYWWCDEMFYCVVKVYDIYTHSCSCFQFDSTTK